MTDTTHEAPERIWVNPHNYWANPTHKDDKKEYVLKSHSDDLVQAAVAAALREAINRVNGCDRVSEVQPAILALITPDAQAALAAERERAHNAGRKHERDLIYAFAQRMDTEGKAYAEQILAAIRKGGE